MKPEIDSNESSSSNKLLDQLLEYSSTCGSPKY